jgi:uncharacterized protein (DUF427 family)
MFQRKKPIEPKSGQESVWDYPRPPRIERQARRVRIVFAGVTIADSDKAWRILETSHPPTIYIPQQDIQMNHLVRADGSSFCEWKGQAQYWSVEVDGLREERCAWSYASPNKRYAELKDHISFYPSRMEACYLDEELVKAQEGDFYGGWITSEIVGPFKGGAGTWGW